MNFSLPYISRKLGKALGKIEAIMNDFRVWMYSTMAVSYSEEFLKQQLMEITQQLTDFLNTNDLVKKKIPNGIWQKDPNFEIRFSDLTDDGKLVVMDGLDRWLRSIDDIRKPVNVKSLERTLRKIRKART